MNIKTKFSPTNKAWLILNNKVKACEIRYIYITITDTSIDITYTLFAHLGTTPESRLFKTKQELLDSL